MEAIDVMMKCVPGCGTLLLFQRRAAPNFILATPVILLRTSLSRRYNFPPSGAVCCGLKVSGSIDGDVYDLVPGPMQLDRCVF